MNTKISDKGFASLIFFTSQAMFLGVGITQILNSSNQSSVFSVLIGSIIGIIMLLFFLKLFNYEKDLTIFEKIEKLYGKTLGNIINIILIFIFIVYFVYTLWSLSIYIQNKYLDKTPSIIILILFLLPTVYSVNKGIKAISKSAFILFIISIIEILLCIFGLTNFVEIDNLKPFFNDSKFTILKDSFLFMSYFLSPAFFMLVVPKNRIANSNKVNKYITIFYIISTINFFLMFTFMIGIFGIELSKLFYYPEFALIRKINYFNFIQHIENILSSQWLFSLYITSVLNLYYIKEFCNHKNIKSNKLYYIFIIVCAYIGSKLFENTTIGYLMAKRYFSLTFAVPIFILIIISVIIIKIKKNKH